MTDVEAQRTPSATGRTLGAARAQWHRVLGVFRASGTPERDPRSRLERVLIALLVTVPMVTTAVALLPELTIGVPSVNDDKLHYLFIVNANAALEGGRSVFDHWLPQIELGVPQFLIYQHLPHLVVVGLHRAVLGSIDLLTVFNAVRYLLLVAFPLTVFWSMRRMGFSTVAAAVAAAVSPLLSGAQNYGFEYGSYVWRGWGMYTQLWAMHLSFITLALVYRAVTAGRGMAGAVVAFTALVLSHLIYAYMMVITIGVVVLIGIRRSNARQRLARLGVIAVLAALISSSMWLPFVLSLPYLNATPYLQPYKYDSFGAPAILGWLVSGHLYDAGRVPVLTMLLAIGIPVALLVRRRPGFVALALFLVWLVLYFGRPSVAFLLDLLPLHDSLLVHRFVGSVDLAAIMLMGLGGAALWTVLSGDGARRRLLLTGAAFTVALVPALAERSGFHDLNTAWMTRTQRSVALDGNGAALIARLRTLPPGRVYAGLPAGWGKELRNQDLPFYDRLPFEGLVAAGPPSESLSLNADYLWDFDERNRAHYDLLNARYVVVPSGLPLPDFLTKIEQFGGYTLYEAPTSGYAAYVAITGWEPAADQAALFARNRAWVNGPGPANRAHVAYAYPSAGAGAAGTPLARCPDGGEVITQDVSADRFAFLTRCATTSPLVIRTTFHPNWAVTVDGVPTPTFMMSPSYIGVVVPAGTHAVVATYQATPVKAPLLLVGAAVLLVTLLSARRLPQAADAIAARLRWPGGADAARGPSRAGSRPLPGTRSGRRPSPRGCLRALAGRLAAAIGARPRVAFHGALLLVSALSAVVAGRVAGPDGPWLWNFDMPYFNYPLASFFHEALMQGQLPLWNDRLGLGFPLYAEGQIGAFYPPNWLIFLLPPLQALDVARLVHLTLLGLGTGILAFRIAGSRAGALMAAAAIVLCGGVVSKLEWTNLITSFAMVPWILLPLVRRPAPTRRGLAAAGVLWGLQALSFHPNVFVFTGLSIAAVLVAIRPRLDTLPRLGALGLIAAGVGAVQLVPTVLLWSLSFRAEGLGGSDLFRLSAMPFDLLGTAFANVFVPAGSPAMNLNLTWYPGGGWSQAEIAAYVGLPILALGALAVRHPRARPLVAAGVVMILLPIVAGQRPALWSAVPIWNAIRAPVKAYLFLDLFLVLLAAVGIGLLQRRRVSMRPAGMIVGLAIAGYVALAAFVQQAPAAFEDAVRRFWSWPPAERAGEVVALAQATLSRAWPVGFEIALGLGVVALLAIAAGRSRPARLVAALAIIPPALLMPSFNQAAPASSFTFAESPVLQRLIEIQPRRVLSLNGPPFWSGIPNQLATVGINDVDMFSSLQLRQHVDLVAALRRADPAGELARAIGVDTIVAVGRDCPGDRPERIPSEDATICRVREPIRAPYWIPAGDASIGPSTGRLVTVPTAHVDARAAGLHALPATRIAASPGTGMYAIAAPADGWLWIDRAWYPTVLTLLDDRPVPTRAAQGGTLVAVTEGFHVVTQELVPWDVALGALVALVTVGATLVSVLAPRRLRSSAAAITRPLRVARRRGPR